MKFRRTPQFEEDFNSLEESARKDVKKAFPGVRDALQGNSELFRHYRIKKMKGWSEIWEGHVKLNLCFTFHYDYNDNDEKICFFRRIGTHDIYKSP